MTSSMKSARRNATSRLFNVFYAFISDPPRNSIQNQ